MQGLQGALGRGVGGCRSLPTPSAPQTGSGVWRQQHEWGPPRNAWCRKPCARILFPAEDALLGAELLLSPSSKGGKGWDPLRWQGPHPARQRVRGTLARVCWQGSGRWWVLPGGVSEHASIQGGWAQGAAALGAVGSHNHPLSSLHSTWPCRPPCSASSTSSCCLPCPRSHPMPRPPASCWHAASLPAASPRCCRPPWGAGEQGG